MDAAAAPGSPLLEACSQTFLLDRVLEAILR